MTRNKTGMPNGSHKPDCWPALLGPFNMGIIMVMKSRFGKVISAALAATAMIAAATPANAALIFNFTFLGSSTAQANQAFIDAGNRWSALFTDNVTINLTVGTASLGTGILASTGSARFLTSYAATAAALTSDSTSANDATAVANLTPGSSFGMLINRTSDNPNGSGSATAYLDNNGSANNSQIRMTSANAKALGFASAGSVVGNCAVACDGSITFGNAFTWDYDPTNGITAGAYDFVGIATHEIGHALGFISGVDILDINSPNPTTPGPFAADQFTYVNTLDLFRYSAASTAAAGGAVIDWTASTTAKYFSIDRGVTVGPGFSTGRTFGDGQQASHWKDSLGLGIMDPTASQGELLAISANDIKAFDVIGWNLRQAVPAVPEPSTWAMMLAGFGLVGLARRRRPVQVASAV
jgi:PEP-CTERM motif